MSVNSLGMTLDAKEHSVQFWPSRAEERAYLTIDGDGTYCEIQMARMHVEALGECLPDVLAGLDRWALEDMACERAAIACHRSADMAAQALDVAQAVEAAGAPDLSASLRQAAAEAIAMANAVDDAVRALENAAEEADRATERLIYITRQAETALRTKRDDVQPAELVDR